MTRIVVIRDIQAQSNTDGERTGAFMHGGILSWEQQAEAARAYGYEMVLFDQQLELHGDDIIFLCDRNLTHFYKGWEMLSDKGLLGRTVAELIESPVVDRKCSVTVLSAIRDAFPYFFTYQDMLVDNHKFYKMWPTIAVPAQMSEKGVKWEDMQLAAIICSNQLISEEPGEYYSERRRIIDWFEEHPEYSFHVYGRGWDDYKCSGGMIVDKADAYGYAKFAFCVENCRRDGYITEKIFDCFAEGIVPVYCGAPNVTKYIPEGCFVDYTKFETLEELVNYLSNMSEEDYEIIQDDIRQFLASDKTGIFDWRNQFNAVNKMFPDGVNDGENRFIVTKQVAYAMKKYIGNYEKWKFYGNVPGFIKHWCKALVNIICFD